MNLAHTPSITHSHFGNILAKGQCENNVFLIDGSDNHKSGTSYTMF